MAEIWPVGSIGSPQVSDFSDPATDYVIRAPVAAGARKARARFTGNAEQVRFSMTFSLSEYRLFKTFYKTNLANGVKDFTMYNPIEEVTITYRFTKRYEVNVVDGLNMQVTLDLIEVTR